GCSLPKSSPISHWVEIVASRLTYHQKPVAAIAKSASMLVLPPPYLRPTSSITRAASPTSPSNFGAASLSNCVPSWATSFSAATSASRYVPSTKSWKSDSDCVRLPAPPHHPLNPSASIRAMNFSHAPTLAAALSLSHCSR